jgi:hypothetical protein
MPLLKPHFSEMRFKVGQILVDHGDVVLVFLLMLLSDRRLMLNNFVHDLMFHRSGGMTARVASSPADVNAAKMTAGMTTRMVGRRALAH